MATTSLSDMSSLQTSADYGENYHDLAGLDRLRRAAKGHDKKALDAAAKQFEAIFIQMMLKSMRKAEDVLAPKDSPFNSDQVKFYRDMHDKQLALDLSKNGTIGLAKIIVQQLGGGKNFTPASFIRNGANLPATTATPSKETQSDSTSSSVTGTISKGFKQPAFASKQDFVQTLLPVAKKVAADTGLDAASLVAQAAVETGWGQAMIHRGDGKNGYNLFGIKADTSWRGDRTLVNTLEYNGSQARQQKAQFRAYGSFEASMRDYAHFIQNRSRYSDAIQVAKQPADYFEQLQKAGYATDPHYAKKVMAVLDGNTLRQAIQQL